MRVSGPDKQAMRHLFEQMAHALTLPDAKAYLDANEAFHVLLYRAAGSPLLMNLISTAWLKVGPLSNRLFDDSAAHGVLNHAHDDVMQALDAGDAAGVRRAIERDLFVAGQFLRRACSAG